MRLNQDSNDKLEGIGTDGPVPLVDGPDVVAFETNAGWPDAGNV